MKRRPFIATLAAGALSASGRAVAQPTEGWRNGFIMPRASSSDPRRPAGTAEFHGAMRERRYVAGRDYHLEKRSIDGRNERCAEVASELVASRVAPGRQHHRPLDDHRRARPETARAAAPSGVRPGQLGGVDRGSCQRARRNGVLLNLTTAKALGLTITPSLLLRADEGTRPSSV